MFDLEKSIATWRHYFARRRGLLQEDLDELERHLRDDVAHAVRQGSPEEAAFEAAVARIGDYDEAEDEYRKVYWGKLRRRRQLGSELAVRYAMLGNYLKTTLRSLLRKKGYSAINIAGLTVGLACCLVIFQYVAFEYSFDRFHEHEPDLYRVLQSTPLIGETFEGGGPYTGFALGPALAEGVPEIRHVARLHPEYNAAIVSSPARPERVFEENRVFYADPSFLQMFTFPLVAGRMEQVLEPGTMLLTESAARKYFGSENPMGQTLHVVGAIEKSYRVTGVLRDVPAQSHIRFDFLLPMEDLVREGYADEPEGGWSWNNFYTYVQLQPGADPSVAEQKMRRFTKPVARPGSASRAGRRACGRNRCGTSTSTPTCPRRRCS